MPDPDEVPGPSVPAADLRPGRAARAGTWAVVNRGAVRAGAGGDADGDDYVAVSRRCRHQLADLSGGGLDGDGCLVCPWHGARYDLATGAMVDGPQGFLAYRGPTPGYSAVVKAVGSVLRLRRRPARRSGDRVVVEE